MIARLFTLSLALCLAACSSGKKESDEGQSFSRRIQSANADKVSPYQKAFNTESAGGTGMSKMFGRKEVRGGELGGIKAFKTGAFKTSGFDMAQQKSSFSDDAANLGVGESRFGRQTIGTRSSRMANISASESGDRFSGGDARVRARSYQPGMKSLMANKRPVITADPNAQQEKVAYTEEEIQKLLGR
jgi:hypothetical protein